MPTSVRSCLVAMIAVAACLGAAACSDDTDDTASATTDTTSSTTSASASGAAASDDLTEYCAVVTELNGVESPTSEQITEWADLVPDEISGPAQTFVAAFEAADGDLEQVFSDPAATAAIDEITAFEAEACGITPPGPPSDAGS